MHWDDDGVVLTLIPFGERNHIASIFTQQHGRHKGIITLTKHLQSVISPGSIANLGWNARLEDHLGRWQVHDASSPMAWILHDRSALYALQAAVTLTEIILPEREIHPQFYHHLQQFIQSLKTGSWLKAYIHFELSLIQHSGQQLDWSSCAVSGSTDNLAFISPRTGRAVTHTVGQPYQDRLLILPQFLIDDSNPTIDDICVAMDLTEYFLKRYSLAIHNLDMPQARWRLKECLSKQRGTMSAT